MSVNRGDNFARWNIDKFILAKKQGKKQVLKINSKISNTSFQSMMYYMGHWLKIALNHLYVAFGIYCMYVSQSKYRKPL
jgi:hypothetical protein